MKTVKPVPIEYVESEFLKSEWYKDFFDPVRQEFHNIVMNPDLLNNSQNYTRKGLLWSWRRPLLCALPIDTEWYLAEITQESFGDILVIRETFWEKTFGDAKKLKDVAQAIKNGVVDQGVGFQIILEIKEKVGKVSFDEKLILITTPNNINQTIIEGNHRAVAFQLKHHESNDASYIPKEVIIGISPNMHMSPWLNWV